MLEEEEEVTSWPPRECACACVCVHVCVCVCVCMYVCVSDVSIEVSAHEQLCA